MSTPRTLSMRSDELTQELHRDPQLLAGVLDGLIEKRAEEVIPAEVQRMAGDIEKDTGVTKEAALKMAWETYVTYVNPGFDKAAAGYTKVTAQKVTKEIPAKKAAATPAPAAGPYKSAEANELVKALGI